MSFENLLIQAEWRTDQHPGAQLVLHTPVAKAAWKIIDSAPFEIDVVVPHGVSVNESGAVSAKGD